MEPNNGEITLLYSMIPFKMIEIYTNASFLKNEDVKN